MSSTKDLLLDRFYLHAPPEELAERSPEVMRAVAEGVWRLSRERTPGTADVRVFNPTQAEDGWTSRHTAIQVCTDDMPFLVDSVLGELEQRDLEVHLLLHPQMPVRDTEQGVEVVEPDEGERVESWMHIEVDRIPLEETRHELAQRLLDVLADVRAAYEDWGDMRQRCHDIIRELENHVPPTVDPDSVQPTIDFLRWLEDHHFTFLGYREYRLEMLDGEEVLRSVPGTGLGILRDTDEGEGSISRLRPEARATAREPRLLTITKANSRATVHRPVYLDYVGIRKFDTRGEVVGERRFLGLFTNSAYAESVTRLPVIGDKVRTILRDSGYAPDSHSGKDLMQVLETYPRDELFQAPIEVLAENAWEILLAQERRAFRLFVRKDEFGRFVSALVYLPRDRFNTAVRLRMERMLVEAYGAETVDYATRVGDQVLAQIHYILRMPRGGSIPDVDVEELERRLQEASRTWEERLAEAVQSHFADEDTIGDVLARYASGFPEAYKEDFDAQTALVDLEHIKSLETRRKGMPLRLYAEPGADPATRRLKCYRDREMPLTEVLPVFTDMGVKVTDERPYTLIGRDGVTRYIYDFGMKAPAQVWEGQHGRTEEEVARAFEEAFGAVWDGTAESDSLNSLVLSAGLHWREVVIVRTVVRYLRQVSSFSLEYIEEAFAANPVLSRLLVELFRARFDPDATGDRDAAVEEVRERIRTALDDVASLDQDRIIRSGVDVVMATLRTNFFRTDEDGRPKPHVSLKLNPRAIEGLPEPRPAFEIWVYAPRVEGVHLRFGAVARGGLRWSDRREDFRTEILGLVKAQMVKNAVIVPTGSKGGFFAKRLPDPSVDREAWLNEGKGAYRIFIKGMLDVTDNRVDGEIVPPDRVVRHDGDDPYLVVAADKGTAAFSDLANEVAREYGFWLDDAFASGGSAGYDHKAMGITARGAWESVKRHFRELGVDTQSEDFTVVGIGDMSGDVFGNGMLLSEHIRLVAAFDHRHIFIDPNPDAATGYAERRRLFELPRSSWADYNTDLISAGGGVFPRTAKAIPVNAHIREALGIEEKVSKMTPAELMKAILKAQVDLLWNGGIGTYVKASTESHADVGDKANDAIRVDGADLRVQVVGEGGNLGLTQLGRIEFARHGGKINTDAIDNSAGVDTSDHEVNIKILLNALVAEGDMTVKQRNKLLAEMTDEVGRLVLRNNYAQNTAIANALAQSKDMLHAQARYLRHLVREGHLDRALEFLPTDRQIRERISNGHGLTGPETAVLLAYTKITVAEELLHTSLPDDPYLSTLLHAYFPTALRERFPEYLVSHPLRREITTTVLVNDTVNTGGTTYLHRLREETGASLEEIVRAQTVARAIFKSSEVWDAVEALDNKVEADVQTRIRLHSRRLVERGTRWLLNNRPQPLELAETIDFFAERVEQVWSQLPKLLKGADLDWYQQIYDELSAAGVPVELATRVAGFSSAFPALDIVSVADRMGKEPLDVAEVYYDLADRLWISQLMDRIIELPRNDRWQSMARASIREDLYAAHAALTSDVLAVGNGTSTPEERFRAWEQKNAAILGRARTTLEEIQGSETFDLANLSVAMRTMRTLLRTHS